MVGGWSNDAELAAKANMIGMTLLVTRGAEGMTLFHEGRVRHYHALAKEVYDVSGAGDTAISALACALERGHTLEEAVPYANKAAGIVVGKFGTTVATEEEVFG
jgi:bifunctional ADP-heptose synthase (sugar kinase/adenylyltransferase)